MTDTIDPNRRALLQVALAGATGALGSAQAAAPTFDPIQPIPATPAKGKPGEFDFLAGEWRIRHQRLKKPGEWDTFEGEATCWNILGGVGSVEELRIPSRNFSGMGLRLLDLKTGVWSDYWVNAASGVLGAAGLTGSFEKGDGLFYADDEENGKPLKGAGIWDQITPTSCRWRQAMSRDGGKTWEQTWIMHWTRVGMAATALPGGARDFDFQRGGEWRVRHRVKRPEGWIEFDGTCRNRGLIDGTANVEEHTFARSTGVTYGIAMRAFDPKSGQWAIWWVDSRDPHAALDPPVKGRFENGVGTFFADYMADGKPMRLRFIWSHITAKSARWEQAISSDEGRTWQTNWTMEFTRPAPSAG